MFEVADFFASQYGLGGCRSLSEYVEMIANTSIETVTRLRLSANNRLRAEAGEDVNKPLANGRFSPTSDHATTAEVTQDVGGSVDKRDTSMISGLLYEFGVDKESILEAKKKISGRQMTLKDYSWIDKHNLGEIPQEEFIKICGEMQKENNKCVHFSLSHESRIEGLKKRRGN